MNKTLSDNEWNQWIRVNETGVLSHQNSGTIPGPVRELEKPAKDLGIQG